MYGDGAGDRYNPDEFYEYEKDVARGGAVEQNERLMQELVRHGVIEDEMYNWKKEVFEEVGGKLAWTRCYDALRTSKRFADPVKKTDIKNNLKGAFVEK